MTRGGRFVPSLASYFCPQGGRSGPLNRVSVKSPPRAAVAAAAAAAVTTFVCPSARPPLMRRGVSHYLEILPPDGRGRRTNGHACMALGHVTAITFFFITMITVLFACFSRTS